MHLIGRPWHITSMSTFRVGIIGLPRIRDSLQQLGVEVVSGETFIEATRNLRQAAEPDGLPVLVEDQRQTGLPQLLTRLSEASQVTIVRKSQPVLDDEWASIPIASSLGDYLRAAGAQEVDPTLDEVTVDEDGSIRGQLPALNPDTPGEADPELDLTPERSAAESSDADDWLSDSDPDESVPTSEDFDAVETAEPEPAQSDSPLEASALDDWLSDGDEPPASPPEPAQADVPQAQATFDTANEDEAVGVDDEDFDGLYAPAPDAKAEQEPTPPSAPRGDTPRRARRRISLPTFAAHPDPEPAQEAPARSAEESIDPELFEGIPAHDVPDDESETELDVDSALDQLAGTSRATVTRLNAVLGMLLVIYGGKGGIGKSTLALCLAQTAAETGGLSVCLIDANRGQGDLGLYMRVRKSDLPSIYDAVTIGDLPSAIITPEQINAARSGAGDQIAFSFVQAPRPQRDGDISVEVAAVSPQHYAEVISLARKRFDLVIVDTQITESLDTSGLIDHAVGPALSRAGYALGMVELSTPGVENLLTSMTYLQRLGADPARMMTIANNVSPDVRELGKIPHLLGQQSKWKGVVRHDQRIYEDMVARRIPNAVPSIREVTTDVLETMTGMVEFSDPEPTGDGRDRLPWWKRWFVR